ncbi:MAG: hypothetical protein QM817_29095 [Archangium sp.]
MTRVACVLVLLLSFCAVAKPRLLDDETLTLTDDRPTLLADYHGAAPLGSPVRPVNPVTPVRNSGSGSLFLLGLGLTAGGLVLGAGGFAVLYVCREGTACHSDATTVIGWVLAAPGIIPLTIGLIMMYVSTGSSGRVTSPKVAPSQSWAFGFTPLKDGGFVSAATRF